jgi:hypothetical protein
MPRALLVLLGASSLLACSRPDAPAPRPDPVVATTTATTAAPPPAPTSTAGPAGLPGDTYCGADGDCVLSCLAGAVNADWYRAWDKKGECDDGCASKGMGARCVDHACEAHDKSDAGVAQCTHTASVPAQWACTKDADCFMSCGKGAVSRAWWEAWDKSGECKDGCAEMNVAKCTKVGCMAFDASGKTQMSCTRR